MENKINQKFKNSYKDEYDALFEAIFGSANDDHQQYGSSSTEDTYDEVNIPTLGNYDSLGTTAIREGDDSTWSKLPNLLLEKIYSHLTMQERYYASMVCYTWYEAFQLPNAWRTFVFDDKTLTRRLFNYYSGWQYMMDHVSAQFCLRRIGRHIRTLIFKPITNFYNLYEFMNMISFYTEQQFHPDCMIKGIGSQIVTLQYTFPCNMATGNETRLYGTGGKLLDALKRLIGNLPSLRSLELVDLMLDSQEALQLLDEICYSLCLTMKRLLLVNISKLQCPLLHAGVFLNLHELTISPQNMDDDVLALVADTQLRHLHIIQNSYTPTEVTPCSWKAWTTCKQRNPFMKVHLQIQSKKDTALIWQNCAPVSTILFNSPKIKAKADTISKAVEKYSTTLRVFGYMSLTRCYQSKSFHERIDSFLIYLCNHCFNIETLIIREKISTATILLIARFARRLKRLYVRKNLVILKSSWPRNPEWDDEMYDWMKSNSRSYQLTEAEVSSILGYRWKMLSDNEFKALRLYLHS